jgi:biotin carboxylase
VTVEGATVVVVGAGYSGKRRVYRTIADLGAQLVLVDEPGHWSESLVREGAASAWIPAPVTGDADADAATMVDALRRGGVRPNAVLTYWEDSVSAAARVAAAFDLPGNSPEAVDAVRSKVRMREVSARLGLPTPKAQRVRSLDELYAAAADVGFPAVVKPEFGASAMGCVRIDDFEALPGVYRLVREVVRPETDGIFRAGNDLLLEEYLDGVEFDVDLVMQDGECVFSSVSQNWPTAEPSFQETGLHCPPDHSRRAVRGLVDLTVQTAQAFGLGDGVLHIEGKSTSRGPRIIEVNARMGGGRIHQLVEAVWGVDLVEAQLRSSLGLPQALKPSRRPRCAVVNAIVHAPATGRLEALPFREVAPEGELGVELDVAAAVGDEVVGPDRTFATVLADLTLSGRNLRRARSLAEEVLHDPPLVASVAKPDAARAPAS